MFAKYIETELGTEKYCKGCDDFYPATKEFFFGAKFRKDGTQALETLCKSCYKEKYKRSLIRTNDIAHRYQEVVV